MNAIALELDFTTIVHTKENSIANEGILNEQRERLTGNCKKLWEAFSRGEKLSGMDIIIKYKMSEYRKRIQEINIALRLSGHPMLQEEKLSNGAKVWWL